MTDLIALAKQAGFVHDVHYDNVDGDNYHTPRYTISPKLQAFADLIAASERESCAVERDRLREALKQIVEVQQSPIGDSSAFRKIARIAQQALEEAR